MEFKVFQTPKDKTVGVFCVNCLRIISEGECFIATTDLKKIVMELEPIKCPYCGAKQNLPRFFDNKEEALAEAELITELWESTKEPSIMMIDDYDKAIKAAEILSKFNTVN